MTNFVFIDMLRSFKRFFQGIMGEDSVFLYELTIALKPRRFDPADSQDKIVYEEE